MNRLQEMIDTALATADGLDEAAAQMHDKPVLRKRLRVAASTIRAQHLNLSNPELFNKQRPREFNLKDFL